MSKPRVYDFNSLAQKLKLSIGDMQMLIDLYGAHEAAKRCDEAIRRGVSPFNVETQERIEASEYEWPGFGW